jgi:hypothetical protein
MNIYLLFSVLTPRSASLLATNKAPGLFITVCLGWITYKS